MGKIKLVLSNFLEKLSGSLQKDLPVLKQMFGDSMDLYAKNLRIRGVECAACMFDGLSSTEKLWVILLDLLSREGPPMPDGAALTNYILHASDLPVEATPVETVPDVEVKEDFIIPQAKETSHDAMAQETGTAENTAKERAVNRQKKDEVDEFDLSDIKAFSDRMSKEDIVAAAEAAAFAE